jgi:hypothetical protein
MSEAGTSAKTKLQARDCIRKNLCNNVSSPCSEARGVQEATRPADWELENWFIGIFVPMH